METRMKKQMKPEPNSWWQALILTVVFALLCFLLYSCKTVGKIEKIETVKVDSVVTVDTIYAEHFYVRYDTTYVHDSYKETYAIGKIDTVYNIRVDTIRVSTVNYIYKELRSETTDSAASVKVNQQKQAATESRSTEKVVEKKNGLKEALMAVIAIAIVGVAAYMLGRIKK